MTTNKRNIQDFRHELENLNLDGFYLSSEDEFLMEYTAVDMKRLHWITGFTGSVGKTIIYKDKAALFVDGRYTTQAKRQTDSSIFDHYDLFAEPPVEWIKNFANSGDKIGFDPWQITHAKYVGLQKTCDEKSIHLTPITPNIVDLLWKDRPEIDFVPVSIYPLNYAGVDFKDKINMICETLKEKNAEASFVTTQDSIAWLLNLRGKDASTEPVFRSYLLIKADGQVILFIDENKISPEVREYLGDNVTLCDIKQLQKGLTDNCQEIKSVYLDPNFTSQFIWDFFEKNNCRIIQGLEVTALPKARKNPTEIASTRAAHIRDGAALTEFLHWLETTGRFKTITESDASDKLLEFRQKREDFKGISFPAISSTEDNSAVLHYNPATGDNKTLPEDCWYLIDSGGQYIDGTTDITRVVCYRDPTSEQKRHYTLVLKGMIALSKVKFPKGTRSYNLDPLARQFLWQDGLNYPHGTGHGVGVYMCVHEGPMNVRPSTTLAFEPGMIVSNEPGVYFEGQYGIRLENLIVVQESDTEGYLEFETLSFAPFYKKLIDDSILTDCERNWLNNYHKQVFEKLSPIIHDEAKAWLEEQTKAL